MTPKEMNNNSIYIKPGGKITLIALKHYVKHWGCTYESMAMVSLCELSCRPSENEQ